MRKRIKNYFIKILVPDYFKLKKDYKSLEREKIEMLSDIYELTKGKNEFKKVTIKAKWNLKFQLDNLIWFGNR